MKPLNSGPTEVILTSFAALLVTVPPTSGGPYRLSRYIDTAVVHVHRCPERNRWLRGPEPRLDGDGVGNGHSLKDGSIYEFYLDEIESLERTLRKTNCPLNLST